MAASIYATPPPDLSSEDTALSDVSNTSSTTNTNTNTNNNSATAAVTASSTIAVTSSTSSTSSASSISSSLNHQYSNIMTNTCESKSSNTTPKLSTSKSKRTIADVFKDKTSLAPHHNSSSSFPNQGGSYSNEGHEENVDSLEQTGTDNVAMAAVAAANAAMQMQLLEALNDAAKKRRKQHNPTRMDDEKKRVCGSTEYGDGEPNIKREQISPGRSQTGGQNPEVDYEDKLSKMFLPKSMEHLKETFELLQQQQQKQLENISKSHKAMDAKMEEREREQQQEMMMMMTDERGEGYQTQMDRQASEEEEQGVYNQNPYQTFCKECGENFENEFKLSLHMLQEHNEGATGSESASGELTPLDILASVKVKMERPDCESPQSGGHNSNLVNSNEPHNSGSNQMGANSKNEQSSWMRQPQMPPMGFPFPPEAAAAAALQAGGYLPLLGVPGFPGVDGLNRPPLRIFNPEAFCELCNKEFCNKYFLKTHKANKHGIYDPVGDTAGPGSQPTNTLNAMNQMFQLQMQQQHQQLQQQHQMQMELAAQQQQHQQSQPPPPPPHTKLLNENSRKDRDEKSSSHQQQQGSSPVYCDICSKRFTNVFAMRRHRNKAHEPNSNSSGGSGSQRNSPNTSQQSNSMDANIVSSTVADLQAASKQFQMPDGFRQDYTLEQEEVSFTPQPRKLSPQSQQQARDANFAHDKLKRLGVINPEAFCELCCKEYCNKYFLRTHKWKRHGIFMPPDDNENLPKIANWPFMNMPGGMPVNLMMAQRLMVGTENNNEESHDQQPNKRIKLEASDVDEEVMAKDSSNNDENQENRSENNQNLSVSSTPEPHKLQGDSPAGLPAGSEAAMGLQNLQKLQSMIQQLNDLNGKRPLPCHLCGREMENQYALQAHLMSEHSGGLEAMAPMGFPSPFLLQQQQQALLKHSPNGSPGSSLMPTMMSGMTTAAAMSVGGELRCTPCDREFSNLPEFQKHITEVHLLGQTKGASPLREGFVTPDRPVNSNPATTNLPPATRPPYTLTPTSSYCEICNKELCNKYFMKTHMQRMHGIEIENGAQIGGVVCNICNKELCSKYFLRVHKHNTHGIIEDGAPLPQPRQNGVNNGENVQQPIPPLATSASESMDNLPRNLNMSPFSSAASEIKSESAAAAASFSDNCPICNRRFRSLKWLRSHLLNDHGSSGMEKLRELEQQYGSLSKPSSPTLKIPNGSSSAGSNSNAATPTHPNVPSPAQLAQALQNLNAQQLLQNIPKQQQQQQMNYKQERNIPSPRLKEYQCSLCSFTTPYYAFLFIHERTHSIINSGGVDESPETDDKVKTTVEEEEDQKIAQSVHMDVDKGANAEESSEVLDESQPTNLSMRTPSPRASSISIKDNVAKDNLNSSPLLTLSRGNSPHNHKDFDSRPKSAACSPIFGLQHQQMLQEMAEQYGKTASYAVPREMTGNSAQPPPQMQAFVIEEVPSDGDCNRFVPSIIYLPVKERITGSMNLTFNLTPV